MTFTAFWVRNPVSANLLMAAVFVGGIYAALNLRREMFPAVETEAITVTVEYAGATPEEVERLVARRVERAVESIEEVDEVISQVYEGLLVTRINLEERANRDRALSDVRSAIDDLRADLPDGAEEPEITSERPILPVISVVVAGEVSESRLRDAARRVRDDLLDLVESSQVTLSGVRDREIWVEVRPEALEEHGVTFEQVGRVLQESNLDLPAGQLKARSGNIRVRTLGETGRAAELADMQVKSLPDGTALRFGELAAVRETFADNVERGRFMGKRAALVTVFKTPEEDAVRIAKAVKKYVKRPAPFGDAIELTATRDLSRFIRQRLDLMVRNAHLGLLLVILVLAVFLELRVALWVAVGLAVSFLGTFLAMMLLGETINLISMFGLIVVLGLLVDDAIVIGESVFTKRRQGLPPEQAAISGTNEVAAPVVTAIFTTMVAFLPMAFLDGRVGAFLRVLPIVVVCALSVSLFEAFVVLPTHLAHKFRPPRPGLLARVGALRQELLEHRLRALFSRVVNRALQWRYATLAGVGGFVLIAAGIVAGGHV
ncbi:MAG: efflux RND transporter permease subunit, partial [Planctomycetota bacterium]